MSEIIETIPFSNWPELVNYLNNIEKGSKIYRGQSNEYLMTPVKPFKVAFRSGNFPGKVECIKWPLLSSFDRYYKGYNYLFGSFLGQQFEDNLFKNRYGKHKLKEIQNLTKCNLLERIYYFQHYGIPTCFLDFSKNPLIALFFSIASVRASNSYPIDKDEKPHIHPPDPFISLYEVDHKKLSNIFSIRHIYKGFSSKTYGTYKVHNFHLAFDIAPLDKCQSDMLNENMKNQDSCFILYDSNGTSLPMDDFLSNELLYRGMKKEILIYEYTLPYNEIFARHNFGSWTNITLFGYLEMSNISGRTLFNDIQGLKYDINFFHH